MTEEIELTLFKIWENHNKYLQITSPQIASPNTVTTQYIVLFSHLTVHVPSVCAVPVTRTRGVQTSPSLLHDGARHHVLELLLQLAQGAEALLRNGGAPLVDLVLLVNCATQHGLDSFSHYVADIIDDKLVLLVIHSSGILTGVGLVRSVT
nr:unnamed protein product [Callosobruchus analis]